MNVTADRTITHIPELIDPELISDSVMHAVRCCYHMQYRKQSYSIKVLAQNF